MKFNKLKAFTLAEVMILLLTLSVLLAAFAPIFTKRVVDVSIDDVWNFVPTDNDKDAYYDDVNRLSTSQAFIGLTPLDKADVGTKSRVGDAGDPAYSKLVIAASDKLGTGMSTTKQPHIHFRYSTNDNDKVGTRVTHLMMRNGSVIFGNSDLISYEKRVKFGSLDGINYETGIITDSSLLSSSFLRSSSSYTAIGYNTMGSNFDSEINTAIGHNAMNFGEGNRGTDEYEGAGNTAVGYTSMLLGYKGLYPAHHTGIGNTAVGAHALDT